MFTIITRIAAVAALVWFAVSLVRLTNLPDTLSEEEKKDLKESLNAQMICAGLLAAAGVVLLSID